MIELLRAPDIKNQPIEAKQKNGHYEGVYHLFFGRDNPKFPETALNKERIEEKRKKRKKTKDKTKKKKERKK